MTYATNVLKELDVQSSIYVPRMDKNSFKELIKLSIKNEKLNFFGTTKSKKAYQASEKTDNINLLFQDYLHIISKKFLNGMILHSNEWDGIVEIGAKLGNTRFLQNGGFILFDDQAHFLSKQNDEMLALQRRFEKDNVEYVREKERFDNETENVKSIKSDNKILKKCIKQIIKDKETEQVFLSNEKLTGEEIQFFEKRIAQLNTTIEDIFNSATLKEAILFRVPNIESVKIKKPSIYASGWSINMDAYFKILQKFEIYKLDCNEEFKYLLIKRKEQFGKTIENILNIKDFEKKSLSDFNIVRGIKPDKWKETSVSIELMELKMQRKENKKLMKNLYDSLTFNEGRDEQEKLPFACEPSVVNSIEIMFSGDINGEIELDGQDYLIKGFSRKEIVTTTQNGNVINTEMIRDTLYTYNLETCTLERQI